MRKQSFTVSAVSGQNVASPVFVTDLHQTPFNIGIGVIVGSSARYTVQHTFDNVLEVSADQATWIGHDYLTATAGTLDGNYAFPVTGVRLLVSGNSTGYATVNFIQAGYP